MGAGRLAGRVGGCGDLGVGEVGYGWEGEEVGEGAWNEWWGGNLGCMMGIRIRARYPFLQLKREIFILERGSGQLCMMSSAGTACTVHKVAVLNPKCGVFCLSTMQDDRLLLELLPSLSSFPKMYRRLARVHPILSSGERQLQTQHYTHCSGKRR